MEQETNSDSDSMNEENVFYFESDHLALRGNRDYSNLLRTIAILESQRVRVHQQLEELAMAKKRYMEDPDVFLRKLKNGEAIIAPDQITIAAIPELGKYDDDMPHEVKVKEEPTTYSTNDAIKTELPIVRGRVMDDSKPETYNQLWSIEEQKRLEELLIEYPEERVEMHRFTKIAKALGNRTPQQVSSRVQKYFQKLHSAGMPIPGRIPKNRRVGQAKSKHYYRPSTFFPSHNVPVHMTEDDFLFSDLNLPSTSTAATQDRTGCNSTDIISEVKAEPLTPDMRQQMLSILEAVKQEKLATPEGYNPDPLSAKCESCENSPVSRSGWRCNTCYCPLNLCVDCLVSQLVERQFDHYSHDVVAETKL
ncbi:ZZ-type zinc finger-containing protein 3 [Stomoxys calcitrans]|uniref:ZZ-type zinc finger-containing protein 3 n=1 Tax=Stomoxys calcitrans TaxID=35570 RepID=UPI0027E2AAB6|nr:ZZ-type zinc finger-containing protein 3 [Stomoxys calcitrans]